MKSNIPSDQLERAQARVTQFLEALRHETECLGSTDDSALRFDPNDAAKTEAPKC